jgi:hypothetical protein
MSAHWLANAENMLVWLMAFLHSCIPVESRSALRLLRHHRPLPGNRSGLRTNLQTPLPDATARLARSHWGHWGTAVRSRLSSHEEAADRGLRSPEVPRLRSPTKVGEGYHEVSNEALHVIPQTAKF